MADVSESDWLPPADAFPHLFGRRDGDATYNAKWLGADGIFVVTKRNAGSVEFVVFETPDWAPDDETQMLFRPKDYFSSTETTTSILHAQPRYGGVFKYDGCHQIEFLDRAFHFCGLRRSREFCSGIVAVLRFCGEQLVGKNWLGDIE